MKSLDWEKLFDESFRELELAFQTQARDVLLEKVGIVSRLANGLAKVKGLFGIGLDELVYFQIEHNQISGIVLSIERQELGIVILGDSTGIKAGTLVKRAFKILGIHVSERLIGAIINPLGNIIEKIDNGKFSSNSIYYPLERPAAPIVKRAPVSVPLQTGIKVIDALIPIGRGQRELILGDRQTGKTTIAIDTIINQKNQNVLCIYCAIGQHVSSVAQVVSTLKEKGAMDYTIVVVSEGHEGPGLQYIAPYAATSIAEFFMEQGRDVLVVYDDLTNHARAYRELTLLLGRPPGREAFPGDIFYLHSRLLERATHLKKEFGGGSLTALPIVETEAQNMAAYIPTNLISITDGQIYLSPTLFGLGVLPAVDVGRSVSRVGGKAQLPSYHAVTGSLKLSYAQFEELENFARFGTKLDSHTLQTINHGRRVRACVKQGVGELYSVEEQLLILLALNAGLFDCVPLEKMDEVQKFLKNNANEIPEQIVLRLKNNHKLDNEDEAKLIEVAKRLIQKVISHE